MNDDALVNVKMENEIQKYGRVPGNGYSLFHFRDELFPYYSEEDFKSSRWKDQRILSALQHGCIGRNARDDNMVTDTGKNMIRAAF